jgi:hypothetical protein
MTLISTVSNRLSPLAEAAAPKATAKTTIPGISTDTLRTPSSMPAEVIRVFACGFGSGVVMALSKGRSGSQVNGLPQRHRMFGAQGGDSAQGGS